MDLTPQQEWMAYKAGACIIPSFIKRKSYKDFRYGGDVFVANGSTVIFNVPTDAASDLLVESIEMVSNLQTASDDLFSVQISDSTYNMPWMSAAAPIRDIAGLGYGQNDLPFPQFVQASTTLTFTITNNSGSDAEVYCGVHGTRLLNLTDNERVGLRKRMAYAYIMTVPSVPGPSATPTINNMQILADSDFLIKELSSWELTKAVFAAAQLAIAATPTATSAEMLVQLTDSACAYNFMNTPMSSRLVFGARRSIWQNAATAYVGASPYRMRKPYLAKANTTIAGQFINLSATASGQFRVVFTGARVYA